LKDANFITIVMPLNIWYNIKKPDFKGT
jgi:hypothetical protein